MPQILAKLKAYTGKSTFEKLNDLVKPQPAVKAEDADDKELWKMLTDLLPISDNVWGEVAFTKELLKKKISPDLKAEMIVKATAAGEFMAEKCQAKYPNLSIEEIVKAEGLVLTYHAEEKIGERILFAMYTPPDKIVVMKNPIMEIVKAMPHWKSENEIKAIVLAHELYHHLECSEPSTYTQSEQIVLWKLPFYESKSQVRALSEIAAMAFSKKMNGLAFSPALLDIVLFYAYNPQEARKMYQEVLGFSLRKES
ncbi:hypothetical protein [Pseudolactococcus hodotermopsidis]|uniref:hypothetical protein n=1 Tax=Pseudolactococcus hodotermopsidis TaxID=2709157 RepID=UPI001554F802|nr:hypothetical protein [Lactococcus hodotermopsidis]